MEANKQKELKFVGLNIHAESTILTKQFYQNLLAEKCLVGMKMRLPKYCAFSFGSLQNPVRSQKCLYINCIYELTVLEELFVHRSSKPLHCFNCQERIQPPDVFFDELIFNQLSIQRANPQVVTYMNDQLDVVDKEGKKFDPSTINNDPLMNKAFIAITLLKQQMLMLKFFDTKCKSDKEKDQEKSFFCQPDDVANWTSEAQKKLIDNFKLK